MWNIYLTTDTHFWHDLMLELWARKKWYEEKILKWISDLREEDTLIHLWDFCIWNDLEWAHKFKQAAKCKTVFVKWNHDKKTNTWYYNHTWFDFICDSFSLFYNWKILYFSHQPSIHRIWDINIHWHSHWNREKHFNIERKESYKDFDWKLYDRSYHKEFAVETFWNRPTSLNFFLSKI